MEKKRNAFLSSPDYSISLLDTNCLKCIKKDNWFMSMEQNTV